MVVWMASASPISWQAALFSSRSPSSSNFWNSFSTARCWRSSTRMASMAVTPCPNAIHEEAGWRVAERGPSGRLTRRALAHRALAWRGTGGDLKGWGRRTRPMPHLAFHLDFARPAEERQRFAAAVVRHFADAMGTGTDHVGVSIATYSRGDLVFGR